MKRLSIILIIFVLLVFGGLAWWNYGAGSATAVAEATFLQVAEDTTDFARATEPNNIQFPRDLGPHDDYQTEWWYYTGNLDDGNGRQFGYQFTIFRRALTPELVEDAASDWRSNQVYLAHFTVSDVANEAFYPHERFSRGAAGLAGAQAVPYRVWLEDWSVEELPSGEVRLLADGGDVALDLLLTQTLPPVLHGDGGLSPKGPEPGNASYYYSQVRQETRGTVRVGDEMIDVTGLSWKDHEYSTSALSEGAIGWDWFSMQFDNGSSLMFFQIRRDDGNLEPYSSGSFIAADGTVTHLSVDDWSLEVLDEWTSPTSGATYPAGWQIEIESLDLALEGRPLMLNQELNVSTVYWEGATAFNGTLAGQPVSGLGYVEMTGYFASMDGRI
ncbi:lipocalin-like domain-containing protein [Candidatus Leptofilum sp.]|uniref:lipocalin-like domain-containing protein n=1 Tax=Candidatus Leptofilum sp. TaxID=3241576 RepID=UPI003B5B8F3B